MKRLLTIIVVLIILVAIIFGGFQFLKSKDLEYQESRALGFLKIISSPDKMEMRIASDLVDLTYDWDNWDNRNENSIENINDNTVSFLAIFIILPFYINNSYGDTSYEKIIYQAK